MGQMEDLDSFDTRLWRVGERVKEMYLKSSVQFWILRKSQVMSYCPRYSLQGVQNWLYPS